MNFDFEYHYQVLLEQQKDHLRDNSQRKTDNRRQLAAFWKKLFVPLSGSKNDRDWLTTHA